MRLTSLTGRWVSTLEAVNRLYEFKQVEDGTMVCVMDSDDGELFVARNQRTFQNSIGFDLTVPSSGVTTENRITIERSTPICWITYAETWVRKNVPCTTRIQITPEKRKFLGQWAEENEEVSMAIRFRPYGRGIRIEVQDSITHAALIVRNPRWAGSTVNFWCFENNEEPESRHYFSISGPNRAYHIITIKDRLIRTA